MTSHAVKSRDGTSISYEKLGRGPAVVLVDGALCRRAFGPMADLAKALAPKFTVFYYDRRGRGDSGDQAAYEPARELEDLAAVVNATGEAPCLYGTSSGAALVLRAAASGVPVGKLAVFEVPFMLDGSHVPEPRNFRERIGAMLQRGDRRGAVKLFLRIVGVPAFGVFMMSLLPNVWPKLCAVAHTLPYDFELLGDTQRGDSLPADWRALMTSIEASTLALVGSKSSAWMQHAMKVVAEVVPQATLRVIPGVNHNVSAKAMAPRLIEHFADRRDGRQSA